MKKKRAHELFKKFIVGKRIDRKASEWFLENLRSSQIGEMPKICFDFAEDRNYGNDLIFSFGLIHVYTTEGDATAMLGYYQSGHYLNYMAAYDEGGYIKFSLPEQSILAGYTGPYISAGREAVFDLAKIKKGRSLYLVDPYGENGRKIFMHNDVYDQKLYHP